MLPTKKACMINYTILKIKISIYRDTIKEVKRQATSK